MSIRIRLILLAAFPMLILACLGMQALWSSYRTSQEMHRIQELTRLSQTISQLVHETQKERGCTAGFIGSQGKDFVSKLTSQREETDKRIELLKAELLEIDESALPTGFAEKIELGMSDLNEIQGNRSKISSLNMPLKQALGYYTKMNGDFLNTIANIASLSSEADLAMEINAYGSFLKSKERAGIERAVISGTFAADRFGDGMYGKFLTLLAEQNAYLDSFHDNAAPEAFTLYEAATTSAPFQEVDSMRAVAKANTGGFGIDAKHWFDTITKKINLLKGVEDQLAEDLIHHATTKQTAADRHVWVLVLGLLIVGSVLVVMAWYIIRSITKSISMLSEVIADIQSNNDLTQTVDLNSKDELGRLATHFNSLISTLKQIIVEVNATSGQVASAASEVSASSEELSDGIKEQSDRVYQMSAAIEEMSSSVQMVADQADKASNDAQNASEIARTGRQVVAETVDGMKGIDEAVSSSAESVSELGRRGDEIGIVIQTINEIAEQTNLLALNAAIEAARAGEHGRGFAVVADEVRKLADRTTQATEEIGESITAIQSETHAAVDRMKHGTKQVSLGVDRATEAGDSLKQIVDSAEGLGQDVTSIASSAKEQAMVAKDVASNIDGINQVAIRSKEQTEQATLAASELSERAEQLQALVRKFKTDA